MYGDEWAPLATMADAHREWHWNTGVPIGQPGCPQDACHPVEDEYDPEWEDAELPLETDMEEVLEALYA